MPVSCEHNADFGNYIGSRFRPGSGKFNKLDPKLPSTAHAFLGTSTSLTWGLRLLEGRLPLITLCKRLKAGCQKVVTWPVQLSGVPSTKVNASLYYYVMLHVVS